MHTDRRDFVKIATVGATGLLLTRTDRLFAEGWPATGTLAINPDISNTKVVYCYDKAMVTKTPSSMTFTAQNGATDSTRVSANMDAMAMKLADKATPDDAWKTIFRSSKAWGSTIVAIKVNTGEPKNMARVAILQKLSAVLVGLGASPSNIKIYDAGGANGAFANPTLYSSYCSLTDSSKIQAVVASRASMGNMVSTTIGGGSSTTCVGDIANGKVDILINVAVNKGHSMANTGTLCMKNHFGTFDPIHDNIIDYIVNINKSDAIVGGSPVRQQLCIVDSLFAMKDGPAGTPNVAPCYLTMGVFGPAVDYLTIKKVREGVMSCTHDGARVNQLITGFGYKTSDPEWIEVPPATDNPEPASDAGAGGTPNASEGKGGGGGGGAKAGQAGRNASAGGRKSTGAAGAGGRTAPAEPSGGAQNSPTGSGGAATHSNPNDDEPTSNTSGSRGDGTGGDSETTTSGHASSGGGSRSREDDEPDANAPASAGCGCHIGSQSSVSHSGAVGLVGAAVAGQLWRFLERRDMLLQNSEVARPAEPSATEGTSVDVADDEIP